MNTVTLIGAGFAGLTLAHELTKQGFHVVIHEKRERVGGMLATESTVYGLIESAANALLADPDIEMLFSELGLPFAERWAERKKRYIYWDGEPRRWPLPLAITARLALRAARLSLGGRSELLPAVGESIASWGRRFGGEEFLERVLAPALQGVYAGDPEKLSAVLLLRSFFGERGPSGNLKGSVAPAGGMQALTEALEKSLIERGVKFEYESNVVLPDRVLQPVVVCTSAWQAGPIVQAARPELAAQLATCESLALVSATCFFRATEHDLLGFGCLFPRSQGFHALGVLFNDCIFAERAAENVRSETWIFGGAGQSDIVACDEDEILRRILHDREHMGGEKVRPLRLKISNWPRAIPHYTTKWEATLRKMKVDPPLYLHGNYLGGLGLAKIYSASRALAMRIRREWSWA